MFWRLCGTREEVSRKKFANRQIFCVSKTIFWSAKENNMYINEEELKNRLTPEEYSVLREKGTETPFSGKLLHDERDGMYKCKVCGQELFSSDAKFDSGTD